MPEQSAFDSFWLDGVFGVEVHLPAPVATQPNVNIFVPSAGNGPGATALRL
jgi:hypothetical protein